MEMTEEEEAWWPPILEPWRFGGGGLAWWIMFVASQSTRRWIDSRAASSSAAMLPVRPGSIVSIVASASVTCADYTCCPGVVPCAATMLTRAVRLTPFLAPFAVSGFAGLWVSASGGAFARGVTQLVFSWLTLEATGSPFMVGVVAAARMVPGMLLGIPAGVLADWADRRLLIIAFNAISVVLLVALVPLVVLG